MKRFIIVLIYFYSFTYSQSDNPYVVVVDDTTVEFGIINLFRNCGALFMMDADLFENSFTITAIDTGEPALCGNCYFNVEIIVSGVDPGEYSAKYYTFDSYGLDSSNNWIHDTTFIDELFFTLNTVNVSNYQILSSNQSECSSNAIGTESNISNDYLLLNNYPNPFNSSTTIEFNISKSGRVNISVYDIAGKHIQTIKNTFYESGNHSLEWKARNESTGIYLLSISTEYAYNTNKVQLIK